MVFLFGFAPEKNVKLFTVSYETSNGIVQEVVSTRSLTPKWHNIQDRDEFTKGKSLAQRIKEKSELPEIDFLIERIKNKVAVKPFDGNIQFNPQGEPRFTVTQQKVGKTLDVRRLRADINVALASGKHQEILAIVKDVQPKSEQEMISSIHLRSAFSTRCSQVPARTANIALALSGYNGLIVQNGQTMSFNHIVGPRTQERGYQCAKIIMDGEFVPGIGGGVCQASTTLFNAALLSGLKIEKSYNHSLEISYVPLGRDAMVSSASDLEIRNNTGGTIYIEAGVKGREVFVNIWGNYTPVKYKPRVEMTKIHDLKNEVIGVDCYGNPNYEQVIIESGKSAKTTTTYLDAYRGEKLVHTYKIRKSHYKGEPRVVRYERTECEAISEKNVNTLRALFSSSIILSPRIRYLLTD